MSADFRFLVTLDVRPDTATKWLARAKEVGSSTTRNASIFTSISTELDQLGQATAELDVAQAAARNRGADQIAERDVKLVAVKKTFRAVAIAVQGLCDQAADQFEAAAIAAAAGFGGKEYPHYRKPDFYAKVLGNGRVQLFVKVPGYRGIRVFYEWMMRTGEGAWVELPGTNSADTIVEGLTPNQVVEFCHRTTVKDVPTAWSRAIEVIVE
jgi:hypothetical protein